MSPETVSLAGMRGLMTADLTGGAAMPPLRPDAPSRSTPSDGLTAAPEGDETAPATLMPLTGALPPNTALLRVHGSPPKDGRDYFRLAFQFRGTSRESRNGDIDEQEVPSLSLADITGRDTWLADHDQLRGWWDQMSRLHEWMQEVRAADPVRLIVWDDTHYQIPWELYYLHEPMEESRSVWLGSVVEIARWSALLRGPDAIYDAEQRASHGRMLLLEMLDPQAAPDGVAHLATHLDSMALRDAEAWLSQLAREDLRFALMMVHCHGEHATDANRFKIAGLAMNDLDHRPMPALRASRPVVILNACNTAKVVRVGPGVSRATRSFAKLFLNKGASAVIATVGEVDLDQTHDFMARLFESAASQHRISSVLLEWRKYHVDRIMTLQRTDPELPGRLEDFFHAFLYVYFGHPDSTLQITRSTAS